jgi:hypothetical protein
MSPAHKLQSIYMVELQYYPQARVSGKINLFFYCTNAIFIPLQSNGYDGELNLEGKIQT